MKEEIQIQPLHDRVLVRSLGSPLTTKDLAPLKSVVKPTATLGLLLIKRDSNLVDGTEGDYRRAPLMGVIVAVGPGKWDDESKFHPTSVKPGEVVVFSDWNDWDDAPRGIYMIREGDIWGYPQHSAQVS